MRFLGSLAVALLILFSCYPQRGYAFQSIDFTPEHSFTAGIEGPAVNKEGALFAVNFREEGTIGKIDSLGKGVVFVNFPEGSIGNGIQFDLEGNMFIADYAGHKVYRIGKGSIQLDVWAEGDATMNQPNDLAIGKNGVIYLSDPNWAAGTGNLWMVPSEGEVVLLESAMGTTNGIEVSPDGNVLYVNESVQRVVWKYDILEDGRIANKKKLISFEDFGLDGMRCDANGNLYIARYDKGTVVIVSPEGVVLDERFLKGKKPSNIAFGGKDGRDCYVTMADRGCVELVRAPYPGSYFTKVMN